jgi:type II secretory pathway component GspD/PulD (secretin)
MNIIYFNYRISLCAFIALLTISVSHVYAGITETEVIQLKYRTADEVKEIIKPLLKKGDVITGTGYQLIIRTSPENLQLVQDIIRKVDLPRRKLQISLKRTSDNDLQNSHTGADARISNRKSDITIRTYSTRTRDDNLGIQRINILEGGSAFIQAGTLVPVGSRTVVSGKHGPVIHDSVEYKDVSSGFYVRPVVNEDRVTLFIRPHQSRFSREGGGKINIQEAETIISGKLNEWLEIGATNQQEQTGESGITYQTKRRGVEQSRILIKVEELR